MDRLLSSQGAAVASTPLCGYASDKRLTAMRWVTFDKTAIVRFKRSVCALHWSHLALNTRRSALHGRRVAGGRLHTCRGPVQCQRPHSAADIICSGRRTVDDAERVRRTLRSSTALLLRRDDTIALDLTSRSTAYVLSLSPERRRELMTIYER